MKMNFYEDAVPAASARRSAHRNFPSSIASKPSKAKWKNSSKRKLKNIKILSTSNGFNLTENGAAFNAKNIFATDGKMGV